MAEEAEGPPAIPPETAALYKEMMEEVQVDVKMSVEIKPAPAGVYGCLP